MNFVIEISYPEKIIAITFARPHVNLGVVVDTLRNRLVDNFYSFRNMGLHRMGPDTVVMDLNRVHDADARLLMTHAEQDLRQFIAGIPYDAVPTYPFSRPVEFSDTHIPDNTNKRMNQRAHAQFMRAQNARYRNIQNQFKNNKKPKGR